MCIIHESILAFINALLTWGKIIVSNMVKKLGILNIIFFKTPAWKLDAASLNRESFVINCSPKQKCVRKAT